jgi:hypothetical protein
LPLGLAFAPRLRAAGGAKGAKTVTSVKTTTETITVAPSPVGKSFGGAGNSTLATFTLSHEATLSWTESQPDSGGDCFEVDDQTGSDLADSGLDCSVGAGTTTLQPGHLHVERRRGRSVDDQFLTA